jgi:hypothetical protein
LQWSPKDFWDATVTELYSGIEGWKESQGIEVKQPLSSKDVDDLKAMMERYPDKP